MPTTSDPPPPPEPWGFTPRQRLALALLTALLLILLGVQALRRPACLDTSSITQDTNLPTLPRRIDPNTASALELSRIPNLAEELARKIIVYRDARLPLIPDHIVFRQPDDLTHIPGIKQKILAQFLPYLEFPPDPENTTTQPEP